MQKRDKSRRWQPRFIQKPVEIGKEYEVEIVEKSKKGEGIAKIRGLVLFVPNANPGDHVTVKVTRMSSRFAEAEVVGHGGTDQSAKEQEQE